MALTDNADPIASLANRVRAQPTVAAPVPQTATPDASPITNLARRLAPATAAIAPQAFDEMTQPTGNVFKTMGNQVRAIAGAIPAVYQDTIGAVSRGAVQGVKDFASGAFGDANTAPAAPSITLSPPGQRLSPNIPAGDGARVATAQPQTVAPADNFTKAVPTSIAGVSKVTGKGIKSPIFTNLDPAQAASDYRTNQPNIVPQPQGNVSAPQANGINFGSGGGASGGSAALNAARAAAADRGDFDAVAASYQKGGGTFNGETAQDTINRETMANLSRAIQQSGGRKKIALLAQQAGLINAQTTGKSAIAEAGLKSAQTGLAQADTAAKVQSTATAKANAAQVGELQKAFVSEADPTRQKRIGDQILTLLGHDPKQDNVQIATQDELVDPTNPALGVKKTPFLINTVTGGVQRVEEAAAGGGMGKKPGATAAQPTAANIARLKLYPNETALFDKQFGAGAAAKILGK